MNATVATLLFLPLACAVFIGIAGRYIPRRAVETVACGGIVVAFLAALGALILRGGSAQDIAFFTWIAAPGLQIDASVRFDALAAPMALMVTFVSGLIHLYSIFFMREDRDYVRYFFYMNLFVFCMLLITMADSLLLIYLGWEGVGVCSYALIGFWYADPEKADAGREALMVTRVADAGFGIAMGICFVTYGTLSIPQITENAAAAGPGAATAVGLLLLLAAMGKSAQLPLSVWLPDAMAGPTPVSALIHAATMVTAGPYLLMRMFPVLQLSQTALAATALIGAASALYAACAALAQHDIKRCLAYSTISQVAYMFLAIGAGDIVGSFFLLLSHAFFKAMLFLAAGCIIQALADEHDIFKMSGVRSRVRGIYPLFLIGCLCLSAFPFIGGFFSKDRILLAAYLYPLGAYKLFWAVGIATAFLTALYTFRLFFVVFCAKPEGPSATSPVPRPMVWLIWPLAVLAVIDGVLNLPAGPGKLWLARYLSGIPGAVIEFAAPGWLHLAMALASSALVLCGIGLAYLRFGRRAETRATALGRVLAAGLYVDILYGRLIVRPYQYIAAFLWWLVDSAVIDGCVEGFSRLLLAASGGLRLATNGSITRYLRIALVGFAALLVLLALSRRLFPW